MCEHSAFVRGEGKILQIFWKTKTLFPYYFVYGVRKKSMEYIAFALLSSYPSANQYMQQLLRQLKIYARESIRPYSFSKS